MKINHLNKFKKRKHFNLQHKIMNKMIILINRNIKMKIMKKIKLIIVNQMKDMLKMEYDMLNIDYIKYI